MVYSHCNQPKLQSFMFTVPILNTLYDVFVDLCFYSVCILSVAGSTFSLRQILGDSNFTRAFNYETRPSITCKQLPWVEDGSNAEVKRNVNCDLYEKKVYVRKCIVGKGEDYRGKVFMTKSGHTCQQWWSKFPHDHRWTPTATNGLELNYCRNPDGDRIGPWCYTTDPERRYETCNIPHCKDEVCITCNGEDYRGQVDHTVSGRECQRWDQQYPHQHIYQPEKYPDKSLDDDYCRNPDASPVPWCYTTDADMERERCEISKCSVVTKRRLRSSYTTNCFRGRGEDYRGKVNETTGGIACQRWDAQYPHEHPFYPNTYECKGLEENYCRNPDGSEAPWCFTSVPEMRTALCLQIKRCADDIEAEDCYHENGKNYRGVVRKTRKGITCQKWSVNMPHKTKINPGTHPDANLTENYCRNPDGDQHGPWCYTTDPKTEFDYCAIKQCGKDSPPPITLCPQESHSSLHIVLLLLCHSLSLISIDVFFQCDPQRDYGGPLACQNSDCWVLEGVIIPMRRCGHPGQPNIFIRVSVYVDWIKKVMEMA
uniref:Kringle domain-containing protein n=1 Tax=Oncorhynchus tshawytscha TaxID=74940 RepID=A0A8C8HJ01_ONCTS